MKTWAEVTESAAFKAMPADEQANAREQYFLEAVAPRVPRGDLAVARRQFDQQTYIRKQELPQGVAPAEAGGGRGAQGGADPDTMPIRDRLSLADAKPKPLARPTPGAMPWSRTPEQAARVAEVTQETAAPMSLADAGPVAGAGAQGPAGALANIRANTAARDARVNPPSIGQRLEQPAPTDQQLPGLTPREVIEGSVSPAKLAADRIQANYGDTTRSPEARPFTLSQNIGADIRDATDNPVARGAAAGFSQLGQIGVGAVRGAADAVGAEDVSKFAQRASNNASTIGDAATKGLTGNDKLIAETTSSIINSLPTLAAGVAGGPAMRLLFAQSAAADYAETGNAAHAVIQGAAEVLGERYGFPEQVKLLKGLVRGMPTNEVAQVFGALLKKEIPGEQLTTALQFLGDKFGPGARNPNATMADYLKQAGDTLAVTIAQTGVMGGGPAALSTTRNALASGDRAIDRSAMNPAERAAQDAGFVAPAERRKQVTQRFDNFVAEHGMPPKAAQAIKAATDELPLAEVPGFIKRATQALAKRGLFRGPTDDAALQVLDEPAPAAAPQPAAGEPAAAMPAADLIDPGQDFTGLDSPEIPATSPGSGRYSVSDAISADGPTTESVRFFARPDGTAGIQRDNGDVIDLTNMIRAGFSPERAIAQAIGDDTTGKNVSTADTTGKATDVSPQSDLATSAADPVVPTDGRSDQRDGGIAAVRPPAGEPTGPSVGRDQPGNAQLPAVGSTERTAAEPVRGGGTPGVVGNGGGTDAALTTLADRFDARGTGPAKTFAAVLRGYAQDLTAGKIDAAEAESKLAQYTKMLGEPAPNAAAPEAKGEVIQSGRAVTRPLEAAAPTTEAINPKVPAENRTTRSSQDGALEPWQMRVNDFGKQSNGNPHWTQSYTGQDDGAYLGDVQATHRKIVQQAIAEGKAVPAEVLADYQDLNLTARTNAKAPRDQAATPAAAPPATAPAADVPGARSPDLQAPRTGDALTIDGKPYTVASVKGKAVKLTGQDGKAKTVSTDSPAWGRAVGMAPTRIENIQNASTSAERAQKTAESAQVAPKLDKRAAAARARMQIDPERDTLLQALAKLGGLRRDVAAREWGMKPEELKHTVTAGGLRAFPFRATGGRDLDSAMEAMREAGFFRGVADEDVASQFEEAVFDEIGGRATLTAEGQMRRAEQMAADDEAQRAADRAAELAAMDDPTWDPFAPGSTVEAINDFSPDDLEESGYAEMDPEMAATTQRLLAEAETLGLDTEALREDAARGIDTQSEDFYHARLQDAARKAIAESRRNAGGAEPREARPGAADNRQAAGDQGGQEQGQAEGLTLDAQSPADLKAKADREATARAADAKEQKRLADKAKADAQRGEFTLTGSDGAADVAAAAGQTDIFSAPAEDQNPIKKPAASANTIFTEDAAAAARALLKRKLGQINSGLDPELMQAGITLAGYHIEKGARTFAAYTQAMVGDLGDAVRPYLKSWYAAISFDPRAETLRAGMTPLDKLDEAPVETAAAPAPAAAAEPQIVEHVTGKGKTLRGVIRSDLTGPEAMAIDVGTFKKDGGYFIRDRSFDKLAAFDAERASSPAAPAAPAAPASQKRAPQYDQSDLDGPEGTDGWENLGYVSGDDGVSYAVDYRDFLARGGQRAVRQARIYDQNSVSHMAVWEWSSSRFDDAALSGLRIDMAAFYYSLSDTTEAAFGESASDGDALWARYGRDIASAIRGKKPQAGTQPEERKALEAPAADKPAGSLREALLTEIRANRMPKDNPALRKMVEEFDGQPPTPERMKEAQETLETAIVQMSREIVANNRGEGPRTTFDILTRLYNSQPNLNIRTSTSIDNQAYSTPAPLAFLASELAGITKQSKVLEPTAGTGMLLIGATPSKAHANEINPLRQGLLLDQGFDVTRRDATEPGLDKPGSMDVVITNPPFGPIKNAAGESIKVKVDGYTLGQIDHLIAARALEAMKDDGSAVLIIGANKATGQQSNNDLIFFNWLYGNYNVTSHFEVEGDLYQRQGAGWPVRVITIQGRMKSARVAPDTRTIERASTWSEVYERFQQSLAAQRPAARGGANPVGDRARPANDAQPVPGTADRAPGRADSGRPESSTPGAGNVAGAGAGTVGNRGAVPDQPVGERPGAQRPDERADLADAVDGAETSSGAAEPAGDPRTSGLTDPENQFQAKYVARSGRKDEGVLIPVNMAGPTQDGLNRLEDAVGNIDKFLAKELGYPSVKALHEGFMGLQVDSVASAIQQMKNGKGVIIADQTGIGKGRQAAGVIRWALKAGKIPVFVTVKPSLFTDMYGDLRDIGSDDVQPFILNSSEWIKGEGDEKLFANRPSQHKGNLEGMAATGKLPEGSNALFMTYSQINVANTQRQAVMALAPNAVFILDEAHNAGGDSSTGGFMRDALGLASGVTYLSATFAKRPDNMPLYFKTDIGEAAADDETLMTAMDAGGLPLQTVVSNNLVKAGQMFRRERSYDGVSIETRADTAHKAEHVKLSDATTLALRAIVDADRTFHNSYVKSLQDALKEQGARVLDMAGNQAQQSVDHTQFSSVVHNFVRQMLLGLKAQEAADEAIRSLKRGEKPLIALENTMGSFLSEYAANNALKVGDSLGDFDYRTVLSRALERSRYIVKQLPNGDKVKEYIPLNKLDPSSREAYDKAQKVIDGLDIDIPVSPIDWMRNEITKAGYTVAEVTGRDLSVDYSNPARPKLSQLDAREQKDKVRTTRLFNDGSTDAIILNVAGSTGISLHASEKFKNQSQRHMIVVQAAQDINIFMQMLGRIHRTGQVNLPKYTILNADLPAEIRPTALLSGKMKSLNANTSSNTESATSVKAADMLNKYGDQIVEQYLQDNRPLARALGIELGEQGGEDGGGPEDIARKATGRLALMPVKVQEQFYAEVEEQYASLLDYLNKTNQNDLEPRTFDFDARETKSAVLFEGQNKDSPFGEDAIYGEYSIKAQGKAMSPTEIRAVMAENLAGKSEAEHIKALTTPLQTAYLKMRDGMADEPAQQEMADATARKAANFFDSHRIGKMFRVDINGDLYNAVVTNIRSTHKSAGNPFSMSKIQVTVALNGALRSVTVPATQFQKIETSALYGFDANIEQAFKEGPPNQRETAKIVTGNLLGAYGELNGTRGSIITFTKADGTAEQGILLPKAFNFSKDIRQDYRLKTPADVFDFLAKSQNENIDRFGINSRDQAIRVRPARDGIMIQVPKSKAKGGKYFLDARLRAQTGDFITAGNFMVANVKGRAKAEAALEVLMQKQALYALPSMADEARRILGDEKEAPKFSRRTDQTETPAFRAWFGNSVVVDAEGMPLVVYHGTQGDFAEFKTGRRGAFFASSPDGASAYAGSEAGSQVMPAYLSISNPYIGHVGRRGPEIGAVIAAAKRGGHDGAVVTYDDFPGERAYVAFRPEQIKSAIGNSGAFEPTNPDIRYSRARGATGVPMADAKAVIASIREALPKAPPIHIHESVRQAPKALADFIRKQGADGDVEAAFHDGEIHVFPSNIASIERMQFVVGHHEIRHYGFRGMLGPRLGQVLLGIYAGNPKIREMAKGKVKDGLASTRVLATEEALADLSPEDIAGLKGADKLMSIVRDFLRGVATKLRQVGMGTLADSIEPKGWTDADVARFVLKAEALSRTGDVKFRAGGTVFSGEGQAVMQDLSRIGTKMAAMGYEPSKVDNLQATRKLAALVKRLEEGKITEAYFTMAVKMLSTQMADVTATKAANRLMKDRERGPDIVRERLIRARRQGDMDPEAVDFALWAIDKNPSLADNLGISVRAPNEDSPAADYNPAYEIIRVFKGKADGDTAVHEIMHHAERMMPGDMQAAIRREWSATLAKALAKATPEQKAILMLVPNALAGEKAAYQAIVKGIQEGPLNYADHYQLLNPSEFWAVNAARILGRRFDSKDSIWWRIHGYLFDMVQKIKGLLGLRSEAPILKALKYLLDGSNFGPERGGRFESDTMLSDVRALLTTDGRLPSIRRNPNHSPEQTAALAKAGVSGPPSAAAKAKLYWNRAIALVADRTELAQTFRQGALDQFYGIQRATTRELGALPTDQDPYVTARLANGGTSSVMRALLLHGQAMWAANGQHLEKKPGTVGLLDILKPLGEDVNDWFGWMIGNRAARLMKEGRENNFTPEDIKALQDLGKGKIAAFGKAALEYTAFKRSVLDVAQAAGLIDAEARKTWDHADYVPFYRQVDDKAVFSATGKRGLAGQSSGIRVLKGGESALNDPMENLLMNFSRLIDASLKNNAIRKTVATLKDTDVITKVGYDMTGAIIPADQIRKLLMAAGTPEAAMDAMPPEVFEGMAKMWAIQQPSDPDIVRVMEGGKPLFYRVNDPLLLKALTSFVPFDFPGLSIMRGAKRLLTSMVTSTPEFMIRNWIRDSMAAQAIAKDGFNPVKSITGVVDSFRESGAFEPMLFAGASFQSGNVNAANPEATGVAMRRALRDRGFSAASTEAFIGSLLDTPAKVWEQYRKVGEAIENANREAVFEATGKKTGSVTEAAFESKDLMDFSLRGSWPAYQLLADVLPFFNARVQGLYRLGRSDPKRLAAVGGVIMVASLMLAMANDGEDWYEELPDWDKDTNWHFKISSKHFRIPKPFEIGVIFATIPERIGRSIKGLDTGKKTVSRVWANLRDQLAFDPVPQLVRPILNVWANHDTFRDSPIETQQDEGKSPSARYNARTSDTMRVLAEKASGVSDAAGLSPKRMEYLVNGYFGTVGLYALGLSDMLVRKLEGKPAGPSLRADDIPVVRAFYRLDPARSTVFESDLYKLRIEVEQVAKTIKALEKDGEAQKAQAKIAENRDKLAARPAIIAATGQLAVLNKQRDRIYADKMMSPDEKRQKLDEIQAKKNAIAKRAAMEPRVRALQ